MSNNCKVELKGNLGQDAKHILTDEGAEFLSLSVATTDSYIDKFGVKQLKETVWHQVLVFKPSAMAPAMELKKGDAVYIKGTLSYKKVGNLQQASIIAYTVKKATAKENS